MKHNVVSFAPAAFAFLLLAVVLASAAIAGWAGFQFGRRVGTQASDAVHEGQLQALRAQVGAVQDLRAERAEDFASDQRRQTELESLVAPMRERLRALTDQLQRSEQTRATQTGALEQQLKQLTESASRVSDETSQMRNLLRRSEVRGRWGEDQLERLFEAAGLMPHVHFTTQVTTHGTAQGDEGESRQRPDLVVQLAHGGTIVVDSKVPLDAALSAYDSQDPDEQQAQWKRHAKQVEKHVTTLASKKYWERFDTAPEVVLMFVPQEGLVDRALAHRPDLIDWAIGQRVSIVTPTSLYTLLATVGLGWRQLEIAENATAIHNAARELVTRLETFGGHWRDMAKGLDRAVQAYNKAVGSYDRMVMPSARRLSERAQTDEPTPVIVLENVVRLDQLEHSSARADTLP